MILVFFIVNIQDSVSKVSISFNVSLEDQTTSISWWIKLENSQVITDLKLNHQLKRKRKVMNIIFVYFSFSREQEIDLSVNLWWHYTSN